MNTSKLPIRRTLIFFVSILAGGLAVFSIPSQQEPKLVLETLEGRALLTLSPFFGKPNDPEFAQQQSLYNAGHADGTIDADVDALGAWEITTGSMKTVVAVMDTGVEYTHPDLYENIWLNEGEIPAELANVLTDMDGDGLLTFRDLNADANAACTTDFNGNGYIDGGDLLEDPLWENGLDDDQNGFADDLIGWDTYDDDNDPAPVSNKHGTKSALIIGGVGNNGVGGAGLNWQVRMVPIRVRAGGAARIVSDVVAAFDYALVSDASIVDAAWRSSPRIAENPLETASTFSQEIFDALKRTREAGVLIVTAAGNGSRDTDAHPWFPQSFFVDNIITAAAINSTDDPFSLSTVTNWGATTVEIASPTNNGTTSEALSVTTGVAALIKSQHPDWTYEQIKDRIMQSVDLLPSLAGKIMTGGKLNAAKALGADAGDSGQ